MKKNFLTLMLAAAVLCAGLGSVSTVRADEGTGSNPGGGKGVIHGGLTEEQPTPNDKKGVIHGGLAADSDYDWLDYLTNLLTGVIHGG